MGQIDKIYFKERGRIKLMRIVIGGCCAGLFYYGLYGPYSNMSIEWHYPVSYKFNMAACILMAITEAVLFCVNTLVFTEELGGAKLWQKLELCLSCRMGCALYAIVTFLAFGHWGWPSFNYSSSIDPYMVLATGLSFANFVTHTMELWRQEHNPPFSLSIDSSALRKGLKHLKRAIIITKHGVDKGTQCDRQSFDHESMDVGIQFNGDMENYDVESAGKGADTMHNANVPGDQHGTFESVA